jgi:hypothetical protein
VRRGRASQRLVGSRQPSTRRCTTPASTAGPTWSRTPRSSHRKMPPSGIPPCLRQSQRIRVSRGTLLTSVSPRRGR